MNKVSGHDLQLRIHADLANKGVNLDGILEMRAGTDTMGQFVYVPYRNLAQYNAPDSSVCRGFFVDISDFYIVAVKYGKTICILGELQRFGYNADDAHPIKLEENLNMLKQQGLDANVIQTGAPLSYGNLAQGSAQLALLSLDVPSIVNNLDIVIQWAKDWDSGALG
jgi:hypothetical protein